MNRRLLAVATAILLGAVTPAIAEQVRPTHHDIEVWLDPDERRLKVADRMKISRTGEITLHLAPWLHISELEVNGEMVAIGAPTSTVSLSLDEREEHEIAVTYTGRLTRSRSTSDVADTALIGPQGSYLPAGSGWLPDIGEQQMTYRLTVSVPSRYRAVASGKLEELVAPDTTYKATFTTTRPSEPPSLFAGPYAVREQWHNDIRLRTYFDEEDGDLADHYLQRSARYLNRFSDRIGRYPFANFFVISAPLPVGLGFPNLTYVGRKILPLPFMQGRSLAHEILHNWWGNGVFVDYRAGNWAEGLTTYMADYALAAEQSADAARALRLQWLRDFAALPTDRDFPVIDFTAKSHDAEQVIGYNKVAYIFHMLNEEIGTSAFDAGVRLIWQRHRFRTASWADLRSAFEEASGQNLAIFFEQWLRRPSAPELCLSAADVQTTDAGYQVSVTVGQRPPIYRLSLPVVVETPGDPMRSVIKLDGPQATTTVTVAERPSAVSVDPDYQVFRRLDADEIPPILRDVTLDANAVAVIAVGDADADQAARALAARLIGSKARIVGPEEAIDAGTSFVLIGTTLDVEKASTKAALGPVPEPIAGRGTSRVWVGRHKNGRSFLVVAADNAEALAALIRPLPHYGRVSFLAFDGITAVVTGTAPPQASPLRRRFSTP